MDQPNPSQRVQAAQKLILLFTRCGTVKSEATVEQQVRICSDYGVVDAQLNVVVVVF